MKILWITGLLAQVWAFLKPLLKSEIGKFLADKRVQSLAIRAVERAARLDLDGDGKYDHAASDLAITLKQLGIEYCRGWLGIAVESAWRIVKEQQAKAQAENSDE